MGILFMYFVIFINNYFWLLLLSNYKLCYMFGRALLHICGQFLILFVSLMLLMKRFMWGVHLRFLWFLCNFRLRLSDYELFLQSLKLFRDAIPLGYSRHTRNNLTQFVQNELESPNNICISFGSWSFKLGNILTFFSLWSCHFLAAH